MRQYAELAFLEKMREDADHPAGKAVRTGTYNKKASSKDTVSKLITTGYGGDRARYNTLRRKV
jgi:hypothetical protein